MLGRMVKQDQDHKCCADAYHRAPITPAPLENFSFCLKYETDHSIKPTHRIAMSNGNTRRNRPNNDIKVDQAISNDDSPMAPLIGQEFRQGKSSELAVPRAKTDEDVRSDGLPDAMRRGSQDAADEDQNVAEEDEVAAAEEVAVGAADHEGDRAACGVDGCDPDDVH